jgi:tRNA (cytidine/uridine-2'-O-)-methyltransferase
MQRRTAIITIFLSGKARNWPAGTLDHRNWVEPTGRDRLSGRHDLLRIALYHPDIPGNTGTILRLAACLGLSVDIIEPAGFDISDRNLKRAGMDYLAAVTLMRHVNWPRFEEWRASTGRRLVLASTRAAERYVDFTFRPDDILLFGRESAGVPDHVHDAADGRILIPMVEGQRSINVAMSAAMIAGEALRQTGWG